MTITGRLRPSGHALPPGHRALDDAPGQQQQQHMLSFSAAAQQHTFEADDFLESTARRDGTTRASTDRDEPGGEMDHQIGIGLKGLLGRVGSLQG